MAGHNKWKQIKEKKGVTDKRRSLLFAKLAKLLRVEARLAKGDLNSPSLRSVVEKAKSVNMPKENIERAIESARGGGADEKVTYEAYGPGGCALIIEGLTDSKNRTSAEIKHLLSKHGLELSPPGSAQWAFQKSEEGWIPTTPVPLSEEDSVLLEGLLETLDEHDDVQTVYTNAA